jgi:hypothetical protein
VVSVIGQSGQSYGLVLFGGLDQFERYLDMADAMEAGDELDVPPHFALNFEPGSELPSEALAEARAHGWKVASKSAYPWLVAVDDELVMRPPTHEEVTLGEAVSRAFAVVLKDKGAVRDAFLGNQRFKRTVNVRTHDGFMDVTLRAPYSRTPVTYAPDHDLIAELARLTEGVPAREGEHVRSVDPDDRGPIEEELLRRFAASPEGRALNEVEACEFVLDLAADFLGHTLATLDARGLHDVLFELLPRKVSVGVEDAGWILEELRAFYTFLEREFKLTHAPACLALLSGPALLKLEAALSDRSLFSPAKAVLMAGRAAGFDIDSKEGLEAWLGHAQGQRLEDLFQLGALSGPPARTRPVGPAASGKTKNQLKAERKASKGKSKGKGKSKSKKR